MVSLKTLLLDALVCTVSPIFVMLYMYICTYIVYNSIGSYSFHFHQWHLISGICRQPTDPRDSNRPAKTISSIRMREYRERLKASGRYEE